MKTQFFLFMLLSLFAVQGWASRVDSLETHNPGNNIHADLSGLNLCDGVNKPNGLNDLTVVDQTMVITGDFDPWPFIKDLFTIVPKVNLSIVHITPQQKTAFMLTYTFF